LGAKGDRAAKEPLAKDLYAQGSTLTEISERLDVSVTSLSKWKAESKRPSVDLDEWDQARQGHRAFVDELRAMFKEQLTYVKALKPAERDSAVMDTLSKTAAIVRKWDDIERAEAAKAQEGQAAPEIDRPALFLGNLEWLAIKLRDMDPEGLKVLARNFDALIIQFKSEHANAK
jgi:transcriptional regulator with XRE-family HTH domain